MTGASSTRLRRVGGAIRPVVAICLHPYLIGSRTDRRP